MENVVTNRAVGNTDVSGTSIDYKNDKHSESVIASMREDKQNERTLAFTDPANELFKRRLRASLGIY